MKSITLFFLLVVFSFNLFGQSKITIDGDVKDFENKNISGAQIIFKVNNKEYQSETDSLGRFAVNIEDGIAEIELRYLNLIKKYPAIAFTASKTINFNLERENYLLQEVVIASESKKAISIETSGNLTFNPEKLNLIPSLQGTTDIIKVIQLIPGVQNSGDANGYLYVRGGDPGHNAIMYDGTPIYGMSHLAGIFPFYNADHIEEVQFDKSSANAKYGGRLSSTISLISNKIVPKKTSVKGNIGLLSSQVTCSIPISSKTGLYVSGRKTYINEVASAIQNSQKTNLESETPQLNYGFSDTNLTFLSKVSKKHLFTINTFVSSDNLDVNDPKSNLNANLQWGNLAISSAWNYQISDNRAIKNSLYFTHYNNRLELLQGIAEMNLSSYIQGIGYSNAIQYQLKKISFETGFDYIAHQLQPQKIAITNIGIGAIDKKAPLLKTNTFSLFTSAKPKLLNHFYAEFGLRLNYYSADTKKSSRLNLEPRVVFNYRPNKEFSIFTSYTRQNQYLNLISSSTVGIPSDFWLGSSDGIPSQSSDEFTIGYNQKITPKVNSLSSLYYRKMTNLIEYPYGVTQFNEITSFKNDLLVGEGKSYGLEWMLKKDIGKFKGWLSYTLSWSNRKFEELNDGNPYFAKYDRRHNVSFVGTYDFNPKWSFGFTQIFSSGNRFTMPSSWYFINNNPVKEYNEYNNAQLPNYIRTDLSVNYFIIKSLNKESALNFSIYNTLNIANPIYVVMNVFSDKDNNNNLTISTDNKTLYRILPSISWRFKF